MAIGGVTMENASGVLQAGADSVAVISGLLAGANGGRNIRRRAEEWIRTLSLFSLGRESAPPDR